MGSLGQRVLEKRHLLKVTQHDLATAVGVTAQHISLIEQDKVAPSLSLLVGLATELGTSIDYLVSGKEGIITDTIPSIKADRRLNLKVKKALIALVEEIYDMNQKDTSTNANQGDNQKG
jgi:transcriptional regulator with XRE-family HTH domain